MVTNRKDNKSKSPRNYLLVSLIGVIFLFCARGVFLFEQTLPKSFDFISDAPVISVTQILEHPEAYSTVALSGIAHNDTPLTAHLSKAPCLYCDAIVLYDPDLTTGFKEEVIEERIRQKEFWLQDDTASIEINVDNATFINLTTIFEKYQTHYTPVLPDSSWQPNVLSSYYHYTEQILPPDSFIFVVGQVQVQSDRVTLVAHPALEQPLLISGQSRQMTLNSYQNSSHAGVSMAGGILGLVGVVTVLGGLLGLLSIPFTPSSP